MTNFPQIGARALRNRSVLRLARWGASPVLVLTLLSACGGLVEEDPWDGDRSGDSASDLPLPDLLEPDTGQTDAIDEDVVDCMGDFGVAQEVFRDEGWIPQALTPSRDGLEFFYARTAFNLSVDPEEKRRIMVRRRGHINAPWGEPVELEETKYLCESALSGGQPSALDLSPDGLRLYVACNYQSSFSNVDGPLFVLSRSDRDSPFELQPEPIGQVGISLGLTRDELQAYGTRQGGSPGEVELYQRATTQDAFTAAIPVPGNPSLMNPEPSPDGLLLYGVFRENDNSGTRIGVVRRDAPGLAFGPTETMGLPEPEDGASDYSPALTADCQGMYFSRVHYSASSAVVYLSER